MSLWQRLRRALGKAPPAPVADAAPPRRPPLPQPAEEDDAQRVLTYARRIGPLDQRPPRCDPAIVTALDRLWQSGREAQAVALGAMLADALPHDAGLQLAVAERLCTQRDHAHAEPLLQRALRQAPPRRERLAARALLAEVALARGQRAAALTHLTQVLAEDFRYPGARARLDALRAEAPARPGPGELEDSGLPKGPLAGGLVAPAAPTLLGLPAGPEARYQLQRELGCGSTGTVYLAYDRELDCEVALKVFHPRRRDPANRDGGADGALLRALQEARLLAAVRHPGVIAIYDLFGELPDEAGEAGEAGGPPRLAMELCRGGSLRALLREGPLPAFAALLRAEELLDTLAAVHETSVVHGDLKPENLLFRGPDLHRGDLPPGEARRGDLVVSDFGLARLGRPSGEDSGAGGGTLGYAAPELLAGGAATPASDVYAAAVVALEMLVGELPTRGGEGVDDRSPLALVADTRWAAVATELGAQAAPLRELLAALLSAAPAARPSAAAARDRLAAIRADAPGPPRVLQGSDVAP
jgi:serine/threonine-protein kinase